MSKSSLNLNSEAGFYFAAEVTRFSWPLADSEAPGMNPDNGEAQVIRPNNRINERRSIMKSKRKEKVAKSSKTRFKDLAPKKDARGGRLPEAPRPDGGPTYLTASSISARYKKLANV